AHPQVRLPPGRQRAHGARRAARPAGAQGRGTEGNGQGVTASRRQKEGRAHARPSYFYTRGQAATLLTPQKAASVLTEVPQNAGLLTPQKAASVLTEVPQNAGLLTPQKAASVLTEVPQNAGLLTPQKAASNG